MSNELGKMELYGQSYGCLKISVHNCSSQAQGVCTPRPLGPSPHPHLGPEIGMPRDPENAL